MLLIVSFSCVVNTFRQLKQITVVGWYTHIFCKYITRHSVEVAGPLWYFLYIILLVLTCHIYIIIVDLLTLSLIRLIYTWKSTLINYVIQTPHIYSSFLIDTISLYTSDKNNVTKVISGKIPLTTVMLTHCCYFSFKINFKFNG